MKKNDDENVIFCCCGYLLGMVLSHGIYSARSIDLERALRTDTFRCHFVRVTAALDAHIRFSHFAVPLLLVDHKKYENFDIHLVICFITKIQESH